jgi:hypothetical protein
LRLVLLARCAMLLHEEDIAAHVSCELIVRPGEVVEVLVGGELLEDPQEGYRNLPDRESVDVNICIVEDAQCRLVRYIGIS